MRVFVRFLSFALIFMVAVACASRNLYPHFENTEDVLRRQWTYSIEPISSSLPPNGMEYVSPVIYENTLLFGSDRFGLIIYSDSA